MQLIAFFKQKVNTISMNSSLNEKFTLLLLAFIIISSYALIAQGVSINNDGSYSDESAMLDVFSTDKGILIPRMTTSQRNAITNPAKGLLVYDTTEELFYYNSETSNSPVWVPINSGWQASKSRIKILPSDFLATTKVTTPSPIGYNNSSGTNSNYGIVVLAMPTDLVAFVPIPNGYKATHAKIYGNDTNVSFEVFESDLDDGDITSKGTANVGSEADITDVNSTSTNFLVIIVGIDDEKTDIVYGGYVTIAPM